MAPFIAGALSLPGTCSNGVYTTSGSGDEGGTLYLTASAGGVYKTGPGHAAFFFPQYTTTLSTDLGSQTAPGISFDSVASTDAKNVQVTTNSSGNQFTIQPYSDPSSGTLDTSGAAYTDTISITSTNSPQNGMLLGSVTRTGAGAGTGSVSCIVNKDFDVRVICSGLSPSNNNYPYTVSFHRCPEAAPRTMCEWRRTSRWAPTMTFALRNTRWAMTGAATRFRLRRRIAMDEHYPG